MPALLCCLAVLILLPAACGSRSELSLAAQDEGSGSLSRAISAAFAEAGCRPRLRLAAPGAAADAVSLLAEGKADLIIARGDMLYDAYYGLDARAGQPPLTNMAALACLYPQACQLIAAPGAGIESVADLRGKAVGLGAAGSAEEAAALDILYAYGLGADDIKAHSLDWEQSARALADGRLDACFFLSAPGDAALMALAQAQDINLVPLEQAEADFLRRGYPFYSQYSLGPDRYPFLERAINVAALPMTLVCPADLDEKTAYNLVKSLFGQAAAIAGREALGDYLQPGFAAEAAPIPLHAGALKYYRELGLL